MPRDKLRVVGITRVSTKAQAENGCSMETQRTRMEQYAEFRDLSLVKIFDDPAKSGQTLKQRDGLRQALRCLKEGKAEGLLIPELDRLSRSTHDWQHLIEEYFHPDSRLELIAVSGEIDTRTSAGRMVLNILMAVAQREREHISERTAAVLRLKSEKGEHVGRIPFGKKIDSDTKKLVDDEKEQAVLSLIISMRKKHFSLRKISRKLNELGHRTKYGKLWQHTALRLIIKRKPEL